MSKKYMTVAEAAEHFGVCQKTVRRWVRRARIAALKPNGDRGMMRILRDSVADFERRKTHIAAH